MLSFLRYRYDCWIALLLVIAGWVIFKQVYPFPFITHDGYFYIEAAVLHRDFNVWPIGYSKFLQVARYLPFPVLSVVSFQYLLLEISCWTFFVSWRRFMQPGRMMAVVLFVCLFINPLFWYSCNYLLSDSLFIALSLLWVTQLLWVIFRPAGYMILTHAVLLLLAFSVRYNALYYPLIGSLTFLLCRRGKGFIIAGIGLPLMLLGLFVFYTGKTVEQVTGKWQFSAYGSWKLANNALYMYSHIDAQPTLLLPAKFSALDSVVQQYKETHPPVDLLVDDETAGSYFMFKRTSPLIYYMQQHYGGGPYLNTPKWFLVGPYYASYGAWLIKRYPIKFLQYFAWPNFRRYLFPPAEILAVPTDFFIYEYFPMPIINQYFGIEKQESEKIHRFSDKVALSPFPILFTLSHLFFVIGWIGFMVFGGFKGLPAPVAASLWLVFALWLTDLLFCVFSSAIVLRYQIFMFVMEVAFGMYFVPLIVKNLVAQEKPAL